MHIATAIISILIINIAFGYWRVNTQKFTIQWIAAIHISVLIAIGLRFLLLGWNWLLLPVFVADFAAGQYIGGLVRKQFSKQQRVQLSSCLMTDIIKLRKH
ncbi:MAG: hypothetical protein PHE15_02605 [Dehalococcoidales bacterium]|nr:hypothetical protein [Dehalococcoidales bacterium]